ncbi:MAG: DUF2796 domain-containing protein [Rhodocyclaceae bacterium]|jgi:hypothetical protein|nr:DUF2796 domain-containing protein [Rhodocyclaceae bacterium]
MRNKVIGLLLGVSGVVHAGPPAHEHGVAELRIALDGRSLLVEFESPLDNLVGFEHAPRTIGQRKALQEAEARIGEPAGLFRLPQAAACVAREVEVASPFSDADPDEGTHDHEHRYGHREGDDSGHADVHAAYRFECANPDALDAVELELLRVFPGIRSLRVHSATPRGQSSLRFGPDRARAPLRVAL